MDRTDVIHYCLYTRKIGVVHNRKNTLQLLPGELALHTAHVFLGDETRSDLLLHLTGPLLSSTEHE